MKIIILFNSLIAKNIHKYFILHFKYTNHSYLPQNILKN
jgi:hypothetical protein